MTYNAASELGKFNINVNAIAPGFVATPLVREGKTEEEYAAMIELFSKPTIRVRQEVQFRVQSALRVNVGSKFLGSAGVNSPPRGSSDQPCIHDWGLCLLVPNRCAWAAVDG